jgi:hypothetical protein
VYNAHTKKLITVLDPLSTNVNVQPGIKEERAVVEQNRNTKGGVQSTGNVIRLQGQVDKSKLKTGQVYEVGGRKYKWNGQKLIPSN